MSKGLNMMNELASKMSSSPKMPSHAPAMPPTGDEHTFSMGDLKSHLCPDCHSAIALSMGSKNTKGRKMSTESGNENG